MSPGFGRPMQLLRGEVARFRGLAVKARDGYSAYRQRCYECRCCEVIVIRICSSSHNSYVVGVRRTPDLPANFFLLVDGNGRQQADDCVQTERDNHWFDDGCVLAQQ